MGLDGATELSVIRLSWFYEPWGSLSGGNHSISCGIVGRNGVSPLWRPPLGCDQSSLFSKVVYIRNTGCTKSGLYSKVVSLPRWSLTKVWLKYNNQIVRPSSISLSSGKDFAAGLWQYLTNSKPPPIPPLKSIGKAFSLMQCWSLGNKMHRLNFVFKPWAQRCKFYIVLRKKKWSQNVSILEPFWKTVPLLRVDNFIHL